MDDTIFNYDSAGAIATASDGGISFAAILVIGAILLLLLIALIVVLRRLIHQPNLHGLTREQIKERWQEIVKVSESGTMGAKMAIIEADKLLDTALKSLMMSGSTMGERLKFAGYTYPELRNVWNAHKLRNQLVHETTFELSHSQAKSAIRDFERALRTLHVL